MRIVVCESIEEYACVCARGDPSDIPVLQGSVRWPVVGAQFESFDDFTARVRVSTSDVRADARYGRQPNEVHRLRDGSRRRSDAREAAVLVPTGEAAVCGALLAGVLAVDLHVLDGSLLEAIRAQRSHARRDLIVVALPDELTDPVLLELQTLVAHDLRSDVRWEDIRRVSLVTGRDLPSLSWLVAKTLAARRQAAPIRGTRRVAYYDFPGVGTPTVTERSWDPDPESPRVEGRKTVLQDRTDVLESYLKSSAAIVVATHGFEACADGGAGVVLCGLHAAFAVVDSDRPGTLACARHYPCPRGPRPLPLRQLHTPVLMLASCNSLRFAGSQLDSDFNLGLSFLDGEGRYYVSSPATITHAQASSLVFAAAIAAGRSVSEATLFANALLECGDIEEPTFGAIGVDDDHVPNGSPAPEAFHVAGFPLELDVGDATHAQLVVRDAGICERVQRRTLALDLGVADSSSQVFYFYRLERADGGPGGEPSRVVRIFLFSFPSGLGRMHITDHDVEHLRGSVAAAHDTALYWMDFARLADLHNELPQLATLGNSIEGSQRLATSLVSNSHFDGTAVARARQQAHLLSSLALMTRDTALEHIMGGLSGSFLLTNVWGDEFEAAGRWAGTCPSCGGRALHRRLRHAVRPSARIVASCWRCGYVSDIPDGAGLLSVSLEAPDLAIKDQPCEVRVVIKGDRSTEGTQFRVWGRVNAQSVGHLKPTPDPAHCEMAGGRAVALFRFDLPKNLPPHAFAVRALVASPVAVAAGARGIFVGEGGSAAPADLKRDDAAAVT